MKINNYLNNKLINILSITLKTIVLILGLNIILSTIFSLMNEEIQDYPQKQISHLLSKDVRYNLKN